MMERRRYTQARHPLHERLLKSVHETKRHFYYSPKLSTGVFLFSPKARGSGVISDALNPHGTPIQIAASSNLPFKTNEDNEKHKEKRDLLKHFEFSGEASVWTAMRERAGSKERLPLWTKWVLMPCRCFLPRRSPPWFGRVGKSLVASPLRLLRWKCIAICPCNSLKKISRLLTARRLNEVRMVSSSQWLCLPFHNLTHPSSPDEAIMVPVIFQLTLHTVEP